MRWKLREIILKSQLLKMFLFVEDFVSTIACLCWVGCFSLVFVCMMEMCKLLIVTSFSLLSFPVLPFFACLHHLNMAGSFLYLWRDALDINKFEELSLRERLTRDCAGRRSNPGQIAVRWQVLHRQTRVPDFLTFTPVVLLPTRRQARCFDPRALRERGRICDAGQNV